MDERTDGKPTNAVSFDLEHWHSATLLRSAVTDPVDRVVASTSTVLELLRRHDVRATFFVVGEVAAEYPDLIRRITDAGHELGSHGHTHTPLSELSREAFDRELAASAEAIEAATGVTPAGFRAPNFSVDEGTEWAFEVLEANGYRYDSSVFPARTPMYGVPDAPVEPYRVRTEAPFRKPDVPPDEGLVEFPLSVAHPGLRVPVAGGFYGRVTPAAVLDYCVGALNERGVPANLYVHPWELNPAVKTDAPPLFNRLVSFYGIEGLEAKLDRLFEAHDFAPVGEVLAERASSSPDADRETEPDHTDDVVVHEH
jgi:polysaccharide deacetylase family protein (PEP-CTERM system associated)